MHKLLTFKSTPEQKNFTSSDWHLHHTGPRGAPTLLWESRGYNSAEHMTDEIIRITNQIVRANDNLFFLGDWTLNCSESQFNEDLARIQCQNIYTIWGNHNSRIKDAYRRAVDWWVNDACHDGAGPPPGCDSLTEVEIYPIRYKNLIFLGEKTDIVVDKQIYVLDHYPVISWNSMGKGSIMIHGHCHGNLKLPSIQSSKMIDVSWDVFKRPISFEEIKTICDQKEIMSIDHHKS